MTYCGIDYKYCVSWDYFDKEWSNVKPRIPFKQLPIQEVENGTRICQRVAILKYIENVGDLIINKPVKAAEAMAVLQSAQELFAPLNPTLNFAIGQDFCNKRDNMRANLKAGFHI